MKASPDSVAGLIARLLRARGVTRVFAFAAATSCRSGCGSMREASASSTVRDERAAVHMAQAHAELTGELGVALVTAGPGMTNAITGIANAHVSRAPVLVLSGGNPRPQENRGGLAGYGSHAAGSLHHALRTHGARAVAGACRSSMKRFRAPSAKAASPAPPTSIFRPTRCAASCRRPCSWRSISVPKPRTVTLPDPAQVALAVDLLWSARRVLVISGRGARGAGPELDFAA